MARLERIRLPNNLISSIFAAGISIVIGACAAGRPDPDEARSVIGRHGWSFAISIIRRTGLTKSPWPCNAIDSTIFSLSCLVADGRVMTETPGIPSDV